MNSLKMAAWRVYDRAREKAMSGRVETVRAGYRQVSELTAADGFELLWTVKPLYSRQKDNEQILLKGPVRPGYIPAGRDVYITPPLRGKQYLAVVREAILAGAVPFGMTRTNKLLTDTIDYNRTDGRIDATLEKNIRARTVNLFEEDCRRELLEKEAGIEEACLLFSSWNHYGHWLPEHALKLKKLEEYSAEVGRKVKVIVERDLPGWKKEILSLLGWEEEDLIRWEGQPVKVERLVLPSYPEPSYEDFCWLKDKILKGKEVGRDEQSRLYITRRNFKRRFVVNEEELYPLLEEAGFTVIEPEKMTIRQQAETFAAAAVVAGPHGSGFTNLLYADRARVMELFARRVPLFFFRLSLVMGHDYRPYYCPVKDDLEGDDPLLVDREDFKRSLDEFLSGL